jgi:hypothetical protein
VEGCPELLSKLGGLLEWDEEEGIPNCLFEENTESERREFREGIDGAEQLDILRIAT